MHLLTTSVFNCGHGIGYSYTLVLAVSVLISVVDFSLGVVGKKQMPLPQVQDWTIDYLCGVSEFFNFLKKWYHHLSNFHGKTSPTSYQFAWYVCVLIHVLNNNSFMDIHTSFMDIHDWNIDLHNLI